MKKRNHNESNEDVYKEDINAGNVDKDESESEGNTNWKMNLMINKLNIAYVPPMLRCWFDCDDEHAM